jgi:hypothetical protein
MKFVLLFLIFLLSSTLEITAGKCDSFFFNTQASIDNFSVAYPNCNSFINGITISGTDITNLNGLSAITDSYSLDIINNPLLTNISGLSGLKSLVYLNVENNGLLENLSGLGALTTVSQFRVVFNNSLTSLAGATLLTSLGSNLSIGGNPLLTSLSGLEGITTIGGTLAIGSNDKLADLNGLSGITSLGGFLYIGNNPMLTSLTGLGNLTKVVEYINIENNDALGSLSGLDNINMSQVSYIKILESNILSVCGVASICTFLNSGHPSIIEGNAIGCQNPAQIIASGICQTTLPVTLVSFSGQNNAEGNRLVWQTSSEINNAGFVVESSLNSMNFAKIGFVEGSGDANSDKHYSFVDTKPGSMTYYRLKQMDFDKSSSYSKIIAVKKMKDFPSKVSVYPNPSNGQIFIEAANLEQEYSIKTLNGKIIKEASKLPTRPIDTRNIQNGIYLLTIGNDVFKVMIAN